MRGFNSNADYGSTGILVSNINVLKRGYTNMAETMTSSASVHADHRQWESDLSMWRDDVDRWGKDHEKALVDLQLVQQRLSDHCQAMAAHVNQFDTHEEHVRAHEHNVAETCRSNEGSGEESFVHGHTEEATRHQQLRDAHERMKKHHHTVIAHIAGLKAAFDAML
ncbi:MAG: hypothetical protein KDB00_12470 [Planctomycetales bacterium]|nr:hypothetical protein [Planctomycetales bacterium]